MNIQDYLKTYIENYTQERSGDDSDETKGIIRGMYMLLEEIPDFNIPKYENKQDIFVLALCGLLYEIRTCKIIGIKIYIDENDNKKFYYLLRETNKKTDVLTPPLFYGEELIYSTYKEAFEARKKLYK